MPNSQVVNIHLFFPSLGNWHYRWLSCTQLTAQWLGPEALFSCPLTKIVYNFLLPLVSLWFTYPVSLAAIMIQQFLKTGSQSPLFSNIFPVSRPKANDASVGFCFVSFLVFGGIISQTFGILHIEVTKRMCIWLFWLQSQTTLCLIQ